MIPSPNNFSDWKTYANALRKALLPVVEVLKTIGNAATAATAAAASAVAAAASATSASASATAASAAVTAALGPIAVTGIAGTNVAYTGSSTHNPTGGRLFIWRPHLTSGPASITLALNGTTARSIRMGDGSQPLEGMFRVDRYYPLIFTGTLLVPNNVFLTLAEWDEKEIYTGLELIRTGNFAVSFRAEADAAPRVQMQFMATGELYFRTGGSGSTLPAVKAEIAGNGNIRTLTGVFLDKKNRELFGIYNPPDRGQEAAAHASMSADRMSLDYGNETVNIDSTAIYQVGSADARRLLRVTGGVAAKLTAHHMNPGQETTLVVESGTALVHTGYVGATPGSAPMRFTGLGTATKVLLPQGWAGKIGRNQGSVSLLPNPGVPAAEVVTTAIGSYNIGLLGNGQSWLDQAFDAIPAGMWGEFKRLGLPRAVLPVRFSAAGGSCLWKAGAALTDNPDNYWFDEDTGTLGPRGTEFVTAAGIALAAEGAPSITDFYVVSWYGLSDMLAMDSGDPYYTPVQRATDQAALHALIRTALTAPNLRFLMMPVPPQDVGAFNVKLFGPLRWSILHTCTLDNKAFRGPDTTHFLRPWDNRHHYLRDREKVGMLLAKVIANLGGGTEHIGSKIVAFSRISQNRFQIEIDRLGGAALNRPDKPVGFGITLGTDPTLDRLVVQSAGFDWSGGPPGGNDVLDIYTEGDDGTTVPKLWYPDGAGFEFQSRDQSIYTFTSDTRDVAPLLTWHETI